MAKKSFNKGLEDIFEKSKDQSESTQTLEVVEEPGSKSVKETRKKRKTSRKNFTYDLSNLLSDALTDKPADEELSSSDASERETPKKRIKKVPLSGINALIRRTVDFDQEGDVQREFKRVTFICDRDQVAKLKKIAKSEKTYLKDIIINLIDEYISEHEQKEGRIQN